MAFFAENFKIQGGHAPPFRRPWFHGMKDVKHFSEAFNCWLKISRMSKLLFRCKGLCLKHLAVREISHFIFNNPRNLLRNRRARRNKHQLLFFLKLSRTSTSRYKQLLIAWKDPVTINIPSCSEILRSIFGFLEIGLRFCIHWPKTKTLF